MWQDIQLGWQFWRGQRLRWLFLVLAWGFFSALAVVVAELATKLSHDRPSWAQSPSSIYTLAYDTQGSLVTAKGGDLALVEQHPKVTGFSKYVLRTERVLVDGNRQKLTVLYYEDKLFSILGATKANHLLTDNSGVLASKGLQTVLGQVPKQVRFNAHQIPINGVLPSEFDHFANKSVDLYVPMTVFYQHVPFRGNNATETLAIANALPYYYGLVSTEADFDVASASKFMAQAISAQGEDLVDINLKADITFVSGVEHYPLQRKELIRQLVVLALLLVAFGVVLFSNYFAVCAAMALQRRQEFSLKYAIGASTQAQLGQLIKENVPMLIAVVSVAAICGWGIQHQLYQSELYQKYFGAGAEFRWSLWAGIMALCLIALTALSLLPALNLFSTGFQRGKSGLSKTQQVLYQLQLFVQLALTLTAVNFALSSGYQEWQKQETNALDTSIQGMKVSRSDDLSFAFSTLWKLGQDSNLAISSEPLIDARGPHYRVRLPMSNDSTPYFIDSTYVSRHYFSLLNAKWLLPGQLTQDTVIINESLAQQFLSALPAGANLSSLLGQQVTMHDLADQAFTIAGVVSNLPHAGVQLATKPMVYMSLQNIEELESPIFLYRRGEFNSSGLLSSLNVSPQWGTITELGTVTEQLIELSKNQRGLLLLTLQIALLIFTIMMMGMMYQVKMMLWHQQRKIGVLLALGQQNVHFFITNTLNKLMVYSGSVLLFTWLMWALQPRFKLQLELDIYRLMPVSISILLVLVALLVSCTLVLRSFTKVSIKTLISGQV